MGRNSEHSSSTPADSRLIAPKKIVAASATLPLRIKMLGLILRRIAQNAFQRVLS